MVGSEIPDRVQQPAKSEPLRRAFPTEQPERSESHDLEQLEQSPDRRRPRHYRETEVRTGGSKQHRRQ